MEYIYRMAMTWSNKDEETNNTDIIKIEPSDILFMVMESNYEQNLMPTIFCKLNMDKNKIDKIIKYAKTAEIYLNIYKEQKSGDPAVDVLAKARQVTQYSGTMSYFIQKDINYNKDIDYPDNTNATPTDDKNNTNETNAEVRESFSIGMMFKVCIEWNKQTINNTFLNTTPFNAILNYLQGIPLLIENFKYNEQFTQLIVPPQDSVYDMVKFFNNYKVFYDTPYRFFMDPDCIYILSSSGEATKKKGELYDSVCFNIRSITDPASNQPGMIEVPDQGCYYADINVKDSVYNIDNDTTKKFNGITTIIDPGKNNTITNLDTVSDALNSITEVTDSIKSTISGAIDDVKGIPSDLFDFNGILTDITGLHKNSCSDARIQISNAIPLIQSALQKTVTGDSGVSSTYGITQEEIDKYVKSLNEFMDAISSNSSTVSTIPMVYNQSTGYLNSAISEVTNLTGLINSVSAINASDNVSYIAKRVISARENVANNTNSINNDLIPIINNADACKVNIQNASTVIKQAAYAIEGSDSATIEGGSSSGGLMLEIANKLYDIASTLDGDAKNVQNYNGTIEDTFNKYKNYSLIGQTITQSVQSKVNTLTSKVTNIKSVITNAASNTINLITNSVKSLDRIVNNAKNIANAVKSLDYNIDSLEDLQKDINTISDISKIGLLGISKFDINLNISGKKDTTSLTGQKIIRVSNDNANIIKNEKAALENKENQLTITKENIDTSVLTLNKKYIINNYSAHSNKNGVFLLQRKVDIFTRHGSDEFWDNVQLEFDRIAEPASVGATENSNSATDASKKEQANINSIIDAADAILRRTKNGVDLDDASSIVGSIGKITKEVRKM